MRSWTPRWLAGVVLGRHRDKGGRRESGDEAKAIALQVRKRWLWGGLLVVALLLTAAAGAWVRHRGLQRSPAAVPALSMSEWLAGHSADWRVGRLKEYPGVLVIEFPGLAAQGAAMNRVAALLEKADAPRDRVLDDTELATLIARAGDNSQTFYQGHDYDGDGLARFFALVERQALKLNPAELRLRRHLLSAGLLPAGALPSGAAERTAQALITFTATQADDPATAADETVDVVRRNSVLRHEASHARFYVEAAYRQHCRRFWRDVLTEPQREQLRSYLAGIGYDRRDEELMLNEAQAFMMNTADTRAFTAAGIGMTDDELAALRTRFWQTLPAERAGGRAASSSRAPGAALRRAGVAPGQRRLRKGSLAAKCAADRRPLHSRPARRRAARDTQIRGYRDE